MGLDMYLEKKNYIGAEYAHRKVTGSINIKIDGKPLYISMNKVSEITERAGYWRKVNHVHQWFVDHVQGGKDNCEEHYVHKDKLKELRAVCAKVLETKDASLLPPTEGFFFGSTDIDEYYFDDLIDTIEIIDSLDLENGEYYYRSSW